VLFTVLIALLLLVAAEAAAQAPPHVLLFSLPVELPMPDPFGDKPRADGSKPVERVGTWVLYGRFKKLNFKKELDSDRDTQYSWRKTGPALEGKIYVGIRRAF
jgi:hypothetical protein